MLLIAGPCQIESKEHALHIAGFLKEIAYETGHELIYKSSFDKANRTNLNSQRGVGLDKGLGILKDVKETFNIPVTTDVHETWQVEHVKDIVDMIQIPAFLCRQTDLLIAAGKTNLPVNVKKGQFLAPQDMDHVVEKIKSTNNNNIYVSERGSCFGYNNLVVDFRGIQIMKEAGHKVIFDATHSAQDRKYVPSLVKAACAVGVSGLFIETHENPDKAPSDGKCMVYLKDLKNILYDCK